MTLFLPREREPIAGLDHGFVRPAWRRWMADLMALLGFDNNTKIYDTISASGMNVFLSAFDTDLIRGLCLPNNYKEGTDLSIFFTWYPDDATTGNIIWSLAYQTGKTGADLSATTTIAVTSAAPAVANRLTEVQAGTISGTGLVKGSNILFTLTRDGNNLSDTYAANVTGTVIGVKYQVEGIGTRKVYP